MNLYPALTAELEERGAEQLASLSGLSVETIEAIASGGRSAPFAERDRLARALGANPIDLFRCSDPVEEVRAHLGAAFYVTDAATLRKIDRPSAGAP